MDYETVEQFGGFPQWIPAGPTSVGYSPSATSVLAPEGRNWVARGVSPGIRFPNDPPSPSRATPPRAIRVAPLGLKRLSSCARSRGSRPGLPNSAPLGLRTNDSKALNRFSVGPTEFHQNSTKFIHTPSPRRQARPALLV
jgi:hypothetical protein